MTALPMEPLHPDGGGSATDSGYADAPPRVGFFTDTSLCIGCKACEVACKTWNEVPENGLVFTGNSFDNTETLGADTWRHVKFIEQPKSLGGNLSGIQRGLANPLPIVDLAGAATPAAAPAVDLGLPSSTRPGEEVGGIGTATEFRWLMASDVCKHCTHAACLDVCPTGALSRTEFGTVVVQQDVCNGCGYCVPACPYGVIDKREEDGRVWKCTLCYDRLGNGQEPACAKACPTESIQFGPLDELRERAEQRVAQLQADGVEDARLYGHDPADGVGGDGAFFLLLDEPEVYGLPPDPIVTTRDLASMWKHAAVAAGSLLVGIGACFIGSRP